jgi:ATP-dependent Clp protease, protease subunit
MKNLNFINCFKNQYISITNRINGDGEVSIDAPIGEKILDGEYGFKSFEKDVREIKGDITINIKSYGGDLFSALSIYDYIRSLPNKVITKITGATASAATIIALAGDHRMISANARYLIHKPMVGAMGNSDDFQKILGDLEDLDAGVIKLYVERSNLNEEEVLNLMRAEKFISAEDALRMGFVDEIIQVKNVKINAENMDKKILEALNCSSEEELLERIAKNELVIKNEGEEEVEEEILTETHDETPEETPEEEETVAQAPEEEETVAQAPEEEELLQVDEEEEKMLEKDREIESLRAKVAELEEELKEFQVAADQDKAEEIEEIVENAIKSGTIVSANKEKWAEIGIEKGGSALKVLLSAIPKKSQSSLMQVAKTIKDENKSTIAGLNGKNSIIASWKSGKIDTPTYLELIKNCK